MKRIRLAASILNQTPLDWEGNTSRILEALDTAREQNVGVVCMPELCITGYGCEDMFLSPNTWKIAWEMLEKIVPATKGMVVTLGLPLYVTNGVYNVVCVVADGQIVGFVPKQHLAGDGLHYEPRWFRAWPGETISEYYHGDEVWPIGDLIFEVDGVRMGFEICEDAWVAGRPGNRMAECGVDIILNPSASHFAFGKHETRKRFVLEGSRAFGVSYIYANLVGNEAGRAVYDGGALIASAGELIAAGPRFGFGEVHVTVADIDVELTRSQRASIYSMPTDVSSDVHDRIAKIPGCLATPDSLYESSIEAPPEPEHDEFTQAIALALFDYMRKSFSNGFIVSMSGGADSSAVACLIRCMAERAVQDLGLDGVKKRLNYLKSVSDVASVDDLLGALFTGVYQATRNSSETTRAAAEGITRGVGGAYHET